MGNIVYKITNKINGKLYFGITKNTLKERWTQHLWAFKRKKYYLYIAMQKYGIENFEILTIKECDTTDEMYQLEKDLIKEFNTTNRLFGYNNSMGGEISSKGTIHTEQARINMSIAQKKVIHKPRTQEWRDNIKSIMKERGRDYSVLWLAAAKARARNGNIAANAKAVVLNDCEVFTSVRAAAKIKGISHSCIFANIYGRTKTTKVGIWKFQNSPPTPALISNITPNKY